LTHGQGALLGPRRAQIHQPIAFTLPIAKPPPDTAAVFSGILDSRLRPNKGVTTKLTAHCGNIWPAAAILAITVCVV